MSLEQRLLDINAREVLSRRVRNLLEADERVASVEPSGSITTGCADKFSDIDLRVTLHRGVIDRPFAEQIPGLVASVGTILVNGWGIRMLPAKYVRTLYFAEYPLFWHVDVGCVGGEHLDGSDLLNVCHPTRYFKTWLETLKGVLRGKAEHYPGFVEEMLGRWLELPAFDSSVPAAERLAAYLDPCWQYTKAELEKYDIASSGTADRIRDTQNLETLYARCDELRRTLLPLA